MRQNADSAGGAPEVAGVELAVPPHRYRQDAITSAFAEVCLPDDPAARRMLERISGNAGVRTRHLALPLEEYRELDGFTDSNRAWLECALDLGTEALRGALRRTGTAPEDVDLIASTTVTGLAVPSVEALLAQRVGLREDVRRLPLFGLGCAAGAAGVARVQDYLRAHPGHTAVLLSVELCSLTVRRADHSTANLVAISLFGDGAAAVVLRGADRARGGGPRERAARSRLYPGTREVMGWDIGADGFGIVLSPDVTAIAETHVPKDVHAFLGAHGLGLPDVRSWVCHPGGPKVIQALERALDLPPDALAHTRDSLSALGNLSSASVLDVLRRTLARPPAAGSPGLLTAMGPGFASELVLLRW
jgi:alkylresorcinol/alkylpyrone synthase